MAGLVTPQESDLQEGETPTQPALQKDQGDAVPTKGWTDSPMMAHATL